VPSRQSRSERLAHLLFGAVLIVAVIVVSRALSSILESIYKLHMLLGENIAEIVIADVDHDLLNTTGVLWEF
jgi:hypothetical protein